MPARKHTDPRMRRAGIVPALLAGLALLLAGCAAGRGGPPPKARKPRGPARCPLAGQATVQHPERGSSYTATPLLDVSIRQDGGLVTLRGGASPDPGVPLSEATLKPAPFEILLPRARNAPAAGMNAWPDPDNLPRVAPGASLTDPAGGGAGGSVFGRGWGMAAGRQGYEELYLSRNGHHYLIDERLHPMDAEHEGMAVTALFDLDGVLGKPRETLGLDKLPPVLWLVFFINGNGNTCIDRGEVEALRLAFPRP